MGDSEKIEKNVSREGATIYNLNTLLDEMNFYEAVRVATADLLEIPKNKVPMKDEEFGRSMERFLSDDSPDRFQNQFIGLEYLGKYCVKVHSDGTMVVRELQ